MPYGQTRSALRDYGFVRNRTADPLFYWTAGALLLLASLGIGAVTAWLTETPFPSAVAPFLTCGILLFGLWQWRAQRFEKSLDSYFKRLELANKTRLEHYAKYIEVAIACGDIRQAQRAANQYYVFYMFTEIDNLEYVSRKFALGHMPPELAERALLTFENSCKQSERFWLAAKKVTPKGSAYPSYLLDLVEKVVNKTRPSDHRSMDPAWEGALEDSLHWANTAEEAGEMPCGDA